jgi:translation initiation factor 2B subunit (eIF-2B alpha/beta/delta family)
VRRLQHAGLDAVDVPTSGMGAAVLSSDVLLLEAVAVGPGGFVAVAGSLAAATVARHAEVPVWLAAGVGRLMPARMWDALADRRATRLADPWDLDEEVVPLDLVDRVAGPHGLVDPAAALRRTDCPVAPELFDRGNAPGTYRQ